MHRPHVSMLLAAAVIASQHRAVLMGLDDGPRHGPSYQGRPKRSGIYTKKYSDDRQKRFRKRK